MIILRYWNDAEHIYTSGGIDRGYRPDPRSAQDVKALATLLGGNSFPEGDVGGAASAVRKVIGTGPLVTVGVGLHVDGLARWFALAALVPLLGLVWRRNIL